jgi:hypothetical protein
MYSGLAAQSCALAGDFCRMHDRHLHRRFVSATTDEMTEPARTSSIAAIFISYYLKSIYSQPHQAGLHWNGLC